MTFKKGNRITSIESLLNQETVVLADYGKQERVCWKAEVASWSASAAMSVVQRGVVFEAIEVDNVSVSNDDWNIIVSCFKHIADSTGSVYTANRLIKSGASGKLLKMLGFELKSSFMLRDEQIAVLRKVATAASLDYWFKIADGKIVDRSNGDAPLDTETALFTLNKGVDVDIQKVLTIDELKTYLSTLKQYKVI